MRSKLDLNQVRTFVAVVKQGSFAAAARALSMPTSNVSRYVSHLEARLGTRLLVRTTRHLRITEAGQLLYDRAHALMDNLLQFEAELQHAQTHFSGVLKLCLPSEFGPRFLGAVISEFCAAHPHLQVECHTRLGDLSMARDDVDVAISLQRGAAADSSMVMQPLLSMPSCVVAAPQLLDRHTLPRSVQQLKKLPCISTLSALHGNPWIFVNAAGQSLRIPVSARYRVDSGEMARSAAKQGVGFAILAEGSCKTELAEGSLMRITLDLTPAPLDLMAAYPSRQHASAKVRALLTLIRQRLRPLSCWLRREVPAAPLLAASAGRP